MPGGAFGSTPGLPKRHQNEQKKVFRIRISHGCFRGPPGPHFGRKWVKMIWETSCLDCTGASGSHMGCFQKKSSQGHIWEGFGHRFGGPTAPLGGSLGKKAVKFGRTGRSCCRSYGNQWKSSENQVKWEVKVYLTDKSYD